MEAVLDSLRFAFGPVRYAKAKWSGKGSDGKTKSGGKSAVGKGGGGGPYKRLRSSSPGEEDVVEDGGGEFEEKPLYIKAAGYFSHIFLIIINYLREAAYGAGPLGGGSRKRESFGEKDRDGYPPLLDNFESFYTRCVYRRVKDLFFRPMSSVPGATISIVKRTSDDFNWTLRMDESNRKECINLASYNYLGFAENSGPCTEHAVGSISRFGMSTGSVPRELGGMSVHRELERTVAEFIGAEDAVTFGMGFATNSLNLPRIVSKGCLVMSDEKNHASLILGLKLSGASVKVFKHNNTAELEDMLRAALIKGQPRTGRPWRKVLIVVEGVYSMEGSIVNLPDIIRIKKKYGAYLYLDEAHSVGAMGPHGRGVVDYYGCDPRDVDILMGTFTKSFGSAGGYIAGSRALVAHLRAESHGSCYAASMSAPVAAQIVASMRAIMGEGFGSDGLERIQRLARNTRYFRRRLQQMGGIVYGHDDSPVVPLMIFFPSKIRAVVDGLFDLGVAAVGVGFPATHMTEERVRFCVSASHDKQILDAALEAIDEMCERLNLRYSAKKMFRGQTIEY